MAIRIVADISNSLENSNASAEQLRIKPILRAANDDNYVTFHTALSTRVSHVKNLFEAGCKVKARRELKAFLINSSWDKLTNMHLLQQPGEQFRWNIVSSAQVGATDALCLWMLRKSNKSQGDTDLNNVMRTLSKAHYRMGLWEKDSASKSSNGIRWHQNTETALQWFKSATSLQKGYYKAWAAWALCNFDMIRYYEEAQKQA